MRTTTLKTYVTIAFMAVCLLSIHTSSAQSISARLPHKALKMESIAEKTKQLPVKDEAGVYNSAGRNLSKSKTVDGTGPCLLNGTDLTKAFKNYTGASTFHQPKRINEIFKRKIFAFFNKPKS